MKELREKLRNLDIGCHDKYHLNTDTIEKIIQAVEDYFKQTGKQGGVIRKKQNPDYSAIGKRGVTKRWKK
jgi:hypothetical protein